MLPVGDRATLVELVGLLVDAVRVAQSADLVDLPRCLARGDRGPLYGDCVGVAPLPKQDNHLCLGNPVVWVKVWHGGPASGWDLGRNQPSESGPHETDATPSSTPSVTGITQVTLVRKPH